MLCYEASSPKHHKLFLLIKRDVSSFTTANMPSSSGEARHAILQDDIMEESTGMEMKYEGT